MIAIAVAGPDFSQPLRDYQNLLWLASVQKQIGRLIVLIGISDCLSVFVSLDCRRAALCLCMSVDLLRLKRQVRRLLVCVVLGDNVRI